jgi:excisionase family DNA binding protein
MNSYRRWLESQLKYVEKIDRHPEPQYHHNEELRQIITEAGQLASVAGLPDAVHACDIRTGPIAPNVAREILAACLATIEPGDDQPLTVSQAAEQFNVSKRTLYRLIESGDLSCQRIRNAIRIKPADLQRFLDHQSAPQSKGSLFG